MIRKILAFLLLVNLCSCASMKSYDFIYVNDPEMQMGNSNPKNFELYYQSIREGAIPDNGVKSSGGCGCN